MKNRNKKQSLEIYFADNVSIFIILIKVTSTINRNKPGFFDLKKSKIHKTLHRNTSFRKTSFSRILKGLTKKSHKYEWYKNFVICTMVFSAILSGFNSAFDAASKTLAAGP